MKTLLTLAGPAFSWTWKTSMIAAVLALLVFLTQALLARWLTPRLRYTLSLLVFVRLLLPVAPSSPFSLENLFRHAPRTQGNAVVSLAVASDAEAAPPPLSGRPNDVAVPVTETAAPSTPHLKLAEWLSLGWAGGFIGLLTVGCWRYLLWKRLIRHAEQITEPALLELLENVRAGMNVRHPVRLLAVPRLNSPAVFGVRRICLLLPKEAARRLSTDELRMVFLHEMAHVRRHDVALNFLLIALQYLHWFNPLIWIASHRIRADRELVCDSIVMENIQVAERLQYGQLLLKLLDEFSAQAPVVPQAIAVVSNKQEIKRRLIMIKHHRTGTFGAVSATVLAVIALSSATFTRADNTPAAGGATWSYWNPDQKLGSFFAVAATARETVAVGVDGRIATRENATGKWNVQTFVGDPDFRAIVHAKDQYVDVREKGSIMTSPDGLKWTSQNSPTKEDLLGLFWDGHQYLAGGNHGTILSSADGVTWTPRVSHTQIAIYSFAHSGSMYVAVGNDGVCISKDSINWAEPEKAPTWVPFTACVWTGNEFLACGLGLDRNPTIYTSPDGENWTLRDWTIKASLRAVATINGAVYVAGDSVIAKSTDGGTTWTNTFVNQRGNKLFMGLTTNDDYLIAAGFNHNVWALPIER